ncbi:unnamed protein product, partial [Mesorhabditis spiculigera]
MSKAAHCEPAVVQLPAGGGSAKFRLKNPDTKKYSYFVENSDPANYAIGLEPFGHMPMGESRTVEVVKKPGAPSEAKATIKLFPAIPPGKEHEVDIDNLIKGTPLQQFEVKFVTQ